MQISPSHRPARYLGDATFQPTFLYELIFDLLLAATLIALARKREITPPGLFALYVTGYSAFRIFEELLRVDPSHYILGERLNFWVACACTLAGAGWFALTHATVYFDHPYHSPYEHTLNIDPHAATRIQPARRTARRAE